MVKLWCHSSLTSPAWFLKEITDILHSLSSRSLALRIVLCFTRRTLLRLRKCGRPRLAYTRPGRGLKLLKRRVELGVESHLTGGLLQRRHSALELVTRTVPRIHLGPLTVISDLYVGTIQALVLVHPPQALRDELHARLRMKHKTTRGHFLDKVVFGVEDYAPVRAAVFARRCHANLRTEPVLCERLDFPGYVV